MSHYCNVCCIYTKSKRNYELHCKTARHQSRVQFRTNESIQIKHVCCCGKIFTQQSNLSRHRKECETHKNMKCSAPDFVNELKNQHDEEMKDLKEQIKQLQSEKSITNSTNNTNNNNIDNSIDTQNNNVNISINSFGKENTQYITDGMMEKYVCRVYNGIPMLVKKIHCDPKHPENHNIKMTNHRLPYVKVLNDNNQWVFANKKNTINNLIDKSYLMLETTYEGCRDELPGYSQRNFEQFQTKFIAGDKETMKSLNENVQMVLLNGSL